MNHHHRIKVRWSQQQHTYTQCRDHEMMDQVWSLSDQNFGGWMLQPVHGRKEEDSPSEATYQLCHMDCLYTNNWMHDSYSCKNVLELHKLHLRARTINKGNYSFSSTLVHWTFNLQQIISFVRSQTKLCYLFLFIHIINYFADKDVTVTIKEIWF